MKPYNKYFKSILHARKIRLSKIEKRLKRIEESAYSIGFMASGFPIMMIGLGNLIDYYITMEKFTVLKHDGNIYYYFIGSVMVTISIYMFKKSVIIAILPFLFTLIVLVSIIIFQSVKLPL